MLSFVLEAGDQPQAEAQLRQLRDEYDDVDSHDGLAMALQGYAGLAEEHQAQIEGIGGVSETLIDQAIQFAYALRQRAVDRNSGEFAQDQKDLMSLRNRLIGALHRRMATARRAIRFVFREHPDIVRKASSDYLRKVKRKSRTKQNEETATDSVSSNSLEQPIVSEA